MLCNLIANSYLAAVNTGLLDSQRIALCNRLTKVSRLSQTDLSPLFGGKTNNKIVE